MLVRSKNDTGDTVAAKPETVEVTAATELREAGLAWAADNDVPEVQEAQDGRRPLPRSLQILLASVALGGLALGAFILGRNGVTSHRAPNAASAPPTVTVTSTAAAPAGPPMAHGAVLGAKCDPSGPFAGYAADGSVLVCPPFGQWTPTAGWSGVHERPWVQIPPPRLGNGW